MAMGAVMAPMPMLLLLLLMVAAGGGRAEEGRVAELVRRQSGAPDGVIALDDAAVRQLVASPNRPYSLLVFFDALQMPERHNLKLAELRAEFGLVARSYIRNNAGGEGESKVFFCWMDYHQSQASFAEFGVQSLPHIRWVPAGSSPPKASQVAETDRSAEGMASLVESRGRHRVGRIHRPPLVPPGLVAAAGAALALLTPLLLRRLLLAEGSIPVLNSGRVWCAGALGIYFFSVSGGMHNIIRKMPLFMVDKSGGLVFFYQGSGMQLGVEGFAVASLYTLVGVALAALTHLLLCLRTTAAAATAHRLFMLVAFALAFWSVTRVVSLDNWKTGYQVHAYVPQRWFRS